MTIAAGQHLCPASHSGCAWRAACGMGRAARGVRRAARGVWHVACGVWRVACETRHMMHAA
eukprot:10538526-Lingulodinium_polyedra.AAC.1